LDDFDSLNQLKKTLEKKKEKKKKSIFSFNKKNIISVLMKNDYNQSNNQFKLWY